jgi:hypothetical protein
VLPACCGVLRIGRLAQDAPAQGHGGVGTQDGRGRQATPPVPGHGRLELGAGHPLHVSQRQFAGLHHLQRLGIFVVAGQQQLEGHADLRQQGLAPWALGGQPDEVVHGLHGPVTPGGKDGPA